MKKIIATLVSSTILIACYFANPLFLSFTEDYELIINKPKATPAIQYNTLNSSCEATAQYRYNSQRTGVANKNDTPQSHVQITHHIAPFNVDIHDASKASPTVDETGVYIGSDSGWFFKMDHQGQTLWRFYVPGAQNGIHGSAALDDKKVYIGAYNGFMYALDKENGNLIWANPIGDFIGASPLLADGGLFISAETRNQDGLVARLDCNTGKTLWVSQWLGGHSHSSPSFDKKNQQILVGANSGRFFAFDSRSGKTNWHQQMRGQIKGTALIANDQAYFGAWDKHYHSLNLKTGTPLWKTFMGGRTQTSLSLVPETSIGITNTMAGEITGLNLATGKILWRLRHGDRNHQFSILITRNPSKTGQYFAWSRCKTEKLCILDAKSGKLIHHLELPGSFTSVPYAYQNKVYISLDNNAGFIILE